MTKNGERLNSLLKIALWLAPILAGIAIAGGMYRERVANMGTRIDEVEDMAEATKTDVTGIKIDIEYIKAAVDRIEKWNKESR